MRRFRPPSWAWLATLVCGGVFLAAGAWQLRRGAEKAELLQSVRSAETAAPERFSAPPPARAVPRRITLEGVYDADHVLLLDNQTHAQKPGVRVWTPLRLADGQRVMVDRGWTPLPYERAQPPVNQLPPGMQTVSGLWRGLPEPALKLAGDPCAPASWPRLVQYPDAAALRCVLNGAVADGLLLLDPQWPGGYLREWRAALSAVPPERHYAYAAQWFLFRITLLVLFVKLNLKSHDPE